MRRALLLVALVAAPLVLVSQPAQAVASVTQISAGLDHVCGLTTAQDIYCWGHNDAGQLGDGTTNDSNIPVLVSGGQDWVYVDGGWLHTCAIDTNSDAYCWGFNDTGQLGNGLNGSSNTPVLVIGGYDWVKISAGSSVTCGITTTGDGYCWGSWWFGALGANQSGDEWGPGAEIAGGHTWTTIETSGRHTCGVTATGDGYCWGKNDYGELGSPPSAGATSPLAINGGHSWSSITVAATSQWVIYACGITTDGDGYCWGSNGDGQQGNGGTSDTWAPTIISGSHSWSSLAASSNTITCGVDDSGDAYCAGTNDNGGLGDGTNNDSHIPVAVTGGRQFVSITVAEEVGCGLTVVGTAYCWGLNDYGTLGNGSNVDTNYPVLVLGFSTESASSVVGAIVDPSFSLTIVGRATVCNGQSGTGFQTTSTGTAVDLGHVNASSLAGGAQNVSVTTNAGGGFTVHIRTIGTTPHSLRSGANAIDDVSGTHAAPGAAPSAGTEGFGYTASDVFASNAWAALTNTNETVLVASAGMISDSGCVGYESAVSSTTPAGSYSTTVVYTGVPSF